LVPRPSTARDRLINSAVKLFRRKGYDGVGLTEILEDAEAPKGSFYHHFPEGKEQLASVAVQVAGQFIEKLLTEQFAQAVDFPDGIQRCVEAIATGFEKSFFKEGCPITGVALDTVPQSAVISAAVRDAFNGWTTLLVREARRLGNERFTDDDALNMVMLLEGAWIMARVQANARPIRATGQTLSRMLSP
jgi:TetR/AcrR family transcriptional regulator, lmrAB and yxaGH operons repressor